MTPRGGSQQVLRAWNLRRLLECLEHGPMSQVELAAASGLSEATVSNLVRVLLQDRLAVQETGTRNGRRAKLLRLPDPHRAWQIGIDIGRTRIMVAASSGPAGHSGGEGERVYEADIPVPCPYSLAIDTVARLVERSVADGRTRSDLSGAVAAVPGLVRVSRDTGSQGLLGEGYHQHMGWGSVPLARDLSAALGTEVAVENDCNLAALAEMHAGAARPYRDFMFVLAEAYTGGGLVLGGEIHRGGGGVAGEFGHCVVEPGGRRCWCGGRGCLETVTGEAALIDEVGDRYGGSGPAAARPGPPRDIAEVVARALAGDAACRAAVTNAGTAIGALVGAVATPMDLECVVIGGALSGAGTLLLEAVRAHLTLFVGQLHPTTVAVVTAELGADAPLRGAVLQAAHTNRARSKS